MTYHFTKEERDEINHDFTKAVELLIDMAIKAQLGEQEISLEIGQQDDVNYSDFGFLEHPKINISEDEISLYLTNSSKNCDVYLYKKGKVAYSDADGDFMLDCLFLREFPQIKEAFAESLKEYTKKKWSFWKRFKESHKKNEVIFDEVVIDFPESIDKHTISLEEKDGQKIGTINFGERSIRIITSGNIVLESQSEPEKVKKK